MADESILIPMPRLLHLIPIIHDTSDMGSVGEALARAELDPEMREAALRKRAAVARFWDRVETRVRELPMLDEDAGPLLVYQDGLPVCGREAQIVAETAGKGSRNFSMLQSLMKSGATVMGTEDPELLMKEYELAREAAAGRNDPRRAAAFRRLLEMRDRYIAERINETLPQQRTGVLFLGALHHAEPFLASDIRVEQHVNLLTAA